MNEFVLQDPGGTGQRAEYIWVYLVQHGDQDEAVAAFKTPDGQWFPLVATTDSALDKIAQAAQIIASVSGKPLTLARFDNRTDMAKVVP